MKNLYFNNHTKGSKPIEWLEKQILTEILDGESQFKITMDDGDGNVYIYTIDVSCELSETITQAIREN